MKKRLILLWISATALLGLSGCGSHGGSSGLHEEEAAVEVEEVDLSEDEGITNAADAVYGGTPSGAGRNKGEAEWRELLAAGSVASSDSSRRFVRMATMKFRVKHLATSIYSIEEIARQQGGFVESSDMENSVFSTRTTPLSRDSILETTTHRLSCRMKIRVPSERLDTVLQLISNHIDFLDYRKMEAEDVTLDWQGRQQIDKRYKKYVSDSNRRPRTDSATEATFKRTLEGDEAVLQLRRLNDRIRFSTVTLHLYQRETVRNEVLPQSDEVQPYRPGFWKEAGQALSRGLSVLRIIVLFLFHIWWLILGGAIVWGVLWCRKRFCRKKKQ
ncbi:DUF4349 domain-containing protein [uncultured Rikenella sp.]|uniref:DUF4349 domain-containing protein n=1 Tax=uncultured Rikenella sp. TaxID=368003 RepID=UPI0026150788|nr:DUF4349 domain-containing protein [uncultured Rikenella sp.]